MFLVHAHELRCVAPDGVRSPLPKLLVSRGNFASAAKLLRGLEPVRGTPASASALARWYLAAGDREAAVAVVEEAVQAAHRGEHVSVPVRGWSELAWIGRSWRLRIMGKS